MEKQFVTYEIALKLKELGFDEECLAYYDIKMLFPVEQPLPDEFNTTKTNNIYYNNDFHYTSIKLEDDIIIAPLYQQVIDWCDSKGLLIGTIVVDNLYKSTINKINYETKLFHSRNESIKRAIEFAISYLQDNK